MTAATTAADATEIPAIAPAESLPVPLFSWSTQAFPLGTLPSTQRHLPRRAAAPEGQPSRHVLPSSCTLPDGSAHWAHLSRESHLAHPAYWEHGLVGSQRAPSSLGTYVSLHTHAAAPASTCSRAFCGHCATHARESRSRKRPSAHLRQETAPSSRAHATQPGIPARLSPQGTHLFPRSGLFCGKPPG